MGVGLALAGFAGGAAVSVYLFLYPGTGKVEALFALFVFIAVFIFGVAIAVIPEQTLRAVRFTELVEGRWKLQHYLLVFFGVGFCLTLIWATISSFSEIERADISVKMSFVYPQRPTLVLSNGSRQVIRDIKWTIALWNMDDPRTYVNAAPSPEAHDPLPIPSSNFDFLRPHSSSGPLGLFNSQQVAPFVHDGQILIGTAAVICPSCDRGHSYLLFIKLGFGGWFAEIPTLREGELQMPNNFKKATIENYRRLVEAIPVSERRSIE